MTFFIVNTSSPGLDVLSPMLVVDAYDAASPQQVDSYLVRILIASFSETTLSDKIPWLNLTLCSVYCLDQTFDTIPLPPSLR